MPAEPSVRGGFRRLCTAAGQCSRRAILKDRPRPGCVRGRGTARDMRPYVAVREEHGRRCAIIIINRRADAVFGQVSCLISIEYNSPKTEPERQRLT
jgi:hypothetical protein